MHRELGTLMWDQVGMSRSAAGLQETIDAIPAMKQAFYKDLSLPGSDADYNKALEQAGRVADFFELGDLMARDALERKESCGGHFREEMQTEEGEALRDDENFCHVAAWEYQGPDAPPKRHVEQLNYESVQLTTRSYK
jgi:succinate dehydrogenase / fumarate reductase flavoprotein subunit